MGGRAALRALLIFVAILSVSAAGAVSPPKKPKVSAPTSLVPLVKSGGARPSSAIFPVYGDVYPHGAYYAAMSIGDPPKTYFLDVDTGSDLTWVQCDAPCVHCSKGPHPWYRPRKEKLVSCRHHLCAAVQSIAPLNPPPDESCSQCDYEIHYADHGSSLGVLVADVFTMRLTNSSVVRPALAFGCGYDQRFMNTDDPAPTDGMLGLGSGKVGVLSQLSGQKVTKNVMGHCLGSSAGKGGAVGFLFFGDDLVPANGMTWAPMSRVASENYYSLGAAGLYFGAESLGVRMKDVVLDTGSSYTYFESQPYRAFLTAVKNDLSKKPLKEVNKVQDPLLRECWKGQKPFKTVDDVRSYFKPLSLNFVDGNRASLHLPPENYLIITNDGNACLGILNGAEAGLENLNLIGDVSLQNLMVAYDNDNRRIGWVRTACTRLLSKSEENSHI